MISFSQGKDIAQPVSRVGGCFMGQLISSQARPLGQLGTKLEVFHTVSPEAPKGLDAVSNTDVELPKELAPKIECAEELAGCGLPKELTSFDPNTD